MPPLRAHLEHLRTRWKLGPRAEVGRGARALGRIWVHGGGTVRLGEGVVLDGRSAPIELHARAGAEIAIEDGAAVEGGASLEAVASLRVGARARVGPSCKLLDSNLHPLRGDRHRNDAAALPVVVGAGAVLGARAILLPGAEVPDGATVPPGAVVRPRHRRAPAPLCAAAAPSGDGADAGVARMQEVLRRAQHLLAMARARLALRRCRRGRRVFAYARVQVVADGPIRLGDRVGFTEGMIPTALICHPGAAIEIGDATMFNYGATLEAFGALRVGRGCMVASGVRICDRREDGEVAPVSIGDEVWIAHGAAIGPGVTIGDGSVIAAGAVVLRDVPPGSLAIGAPARCMTLDLVARPA